MILQVLHAIESSCHWVFLDMEAVFVDVFCTFPF